MLPCFLEGTGDIEVCDACIGVDIGRLTAYNFLSDIKTGRVNSDLFSDPRPFSPRRSSGNQKIRPKPNRIDPRLKDVLKVIKGGPIKDGNERLWIIGEHDP